MGEIAYSRHPTVNIDEVLANVGVGHSVADANEIGQHCGNCYEVEVVECLTR